MQHLNMILFFARYFILLLVKKMCNELMQLNFDVIEINLKKWLTEL